MEIEDEDNFDKNLQSPAPPLPFGQPQCQCFEYTQRGHCKHVPVEKKIKVSISALGLGALNGGIIGDNFEEAGSNDTSSSIKVAPSPIVFVPKS